MALVQSQQITGNGLGDIPGPLLRLAVSDGPPSQRLLRAKSLQLPPLVRLIKANIRATSGI